MILWFLVLLSNKDIFFTHAIYFVRLVAKAKCFSPFAGFPQKYGFIRFLEKEKSYSGLESWKSFFLENVRPASLHVEDRNLYSVHYCTCTQ